MRGFDRICGRREVRARRLAVCVAAIVLTTSSLVRAQTEPQTNSNPPATIHAGAVELGVAGALTSVEGIQTGTLWVRTGMFAQGLGGLVGGELSVGYSHVSSLDRFDLAGAVSWGKRWGRSGNYPYVSLAGGWRQEQVGSFGHGRFPVGFGIGMRSLVGQRAGFRVEYGYRRVLNDPVADFNEHEITFGLSIYFRNSQKKQL